MQDNKLMVEKYQTWNRLQIKNVNNRVNNTKENMTNYFLNQAPVRLEEARKNK